MTLWTGKWKQQLRIISKTSSEELAVIGSVFDDRHQPVWKEGLLSFFNRVVPFFLIYL